MSGATMKYFLSLFIVLSVGCKSEDETANVKRPSNGERVNVETWIFSRVIDFKADDGYLTMEGFTTEASADQKEGLTCTDEIPAHECTFNLGRPVSPEQQKTCQDVYSTYTSASGSNLFVVNSLGQCSMTASEKKPE
jgi:hypothetical protein